MATDQVIAWLLAAGLLINIIRAVVFLGLVQRFLRRT